MKIESDLQEQKLSWLAFNAIVPTRICNHVTRFSLLPIVSYRGLTWCAALLHASRYLCVTASNVVLQVHTGERALASGTPRCKVWSRFMHHPCISRARCQSESQCSTTPLLFSLNNVLFSSFAMSHTAALCWRSPRLLFPEIPALSKRCPGARSQLQPHLHHQYTLTASPRSLEDGC